MLQCSIKSQCGNGGAQAPEEGLLTRECSPSTGFNESANSDSGRETSNEAVVLGPSGRH